MSTSKVGIVIRKYATQYNCRNGAVLHRAHTHLNGLCINPNNNTRKAVIYSKWTLISSTKLSWYFNRPITVLWHRCDPGQYRKFINNNSYRVNHMFNNTWLWRYLCPKEIMFAMDLNYKNFEHSVKGLSIKPPLRRFKKQQSDDMMKRLQQ